MAFKNPILKEVASWPIWLTLCSPSVMTREHAARRHHSRLWYPDPAGSFQQRWWDGTAWTNDFAQYRPTLVHSAPAVQALQARAAAISGVAFGQQQNSDVTHFASGQVSAAAAEQAQQAQPAQPAQPLSASAGEDPVQGVDRPPSFDPLPSFNVPAENRAPLTTIGQPNAANVALIAVPSRSAKPVIAAANSSFSTEYQPFGQSPEVILGQKQQSSFRFTVSVWVIAALPAVVVGVAYAIATSLPAIYTTFMQVILLSLFAFSTVALAIRDRFSLRREGHDDAASPLWMLLTPVAYLAARTPAVARETGRSGSLPLVVLLCVVGAIAALLVFVPGLIALLLSANGLY